MSGAYGQSPHNRTLLLTARLGMRATRAISFEALEQSSELDTQRALQ